MKTNQRGRSAPLLSLLGKMNQCSSSGGKPRSDSLSETVCLCVCTCVFFYFIFYSLFSLGIFRDTLWNPGDLETLDGIPVSSQKDMTKRKQGLLEGCCSYHKGEPVVNTLNIQFRNQLGLQISSHNKMHHCDEPFHLMLCTIDYLSLLYQA